jgi:hypothetical protein
MSGVPRSQVLIAHAAEVAETTPIWSSPDQHVTLVKSAIFRNNNSAGAVCQLFARSGDMSVNCCVWSGTLEPNSSLTTEGWFALNPGDQVYAYCGQPGVQVWISGAVLAGPNQFPPAMRRLPRIEPHG